MPRIGLDGVLDHYNRLALRDGQPDAGCPVTVARGIGQSLKCRAPAPSIALSLVGYQRQRTIIIPNGVENLRLLPE
jgi:hypothetical protein